MFNEEYMANYGKNLANFLACWRRDLKTPDLKFYIGELAPKWLQSTIVKSRQDLALPALKWYVSQQPPTNHERVNAIDVTRELEKVAAKDIDLIHIKAFDLPNQEKKLVMDTAGIVRLGELIAESYLKPQ